MLFLLVMGKVFVCFDQRMFECYSGSVDKVLREVSVMLGKSFFKIICVSAIGAGALVSGAPQSFSQSGKLKDPGYGLHMQRRMKNQKKKKTESGLIFSIKELGRWEQVQKRYTKRYEGRISEVMGGRENIDYSITTLRIAYPRTPYYDPFGRFTIQKMTAFAYTADTSADQLEVNEALVGYRDLLYKHLVNLDVLEYALTLAHANPIFGNKIRLKEIYDALRKDIRGVSKRRGTIPEDAYRIVTYGEETYLLGVHKATVKKSEIYRVQNSFYNVHDVVLEDGQYSQFYFDVTWPIYIYEKSRALKDREETFSMPAQ